MALNESESRAERNPRARCAARATCTTDWQLVRAAQSITDCHVQRHPGARPMAKGSRPDGGYQANREMPMTVRLWPCRTPAADERRLHRRYPTFNPGGPQYAEQRPLGGIASMPAVDPLPTPRVLHSGRRNRSKPPFELRQRRILTFSDWMPARKGKNRICPRPAAAGGHRRRVRSIGRSAAPVCPGLRVRPAPQLVATTVTVAAHSCTTPGGLVLDSASLPARGHSGVRARREVPPQARGAARRCPKSTLVPPHRLLRTQPRGLK
jgi:hypothetical protein